LFFSQLSTPTTKPTKNMNTIQCK